MMQRSVRGVAPYLFRDYRKHINIRFVCHMSFISIARPIATKHYQALTTKTLLPIRYLHGNQSKETGDVYNFKLMDFEHIAWPNIVKSFRNVFMAFLIRGYYDTNFTTKDFLKGAEQALGTVSHFISSGDFDSLIDLISPKALDEIKKNFAGLNAEQKKFIAVNPNDLFFKMIYEIGMIFDDNSKKRFVEITTVLQGFHGLDKIREESVDNLALKMEAEPHQLFICNYRFIREFTEGVESSWVINKLNHFSPKIK